MLDRHSLLWRLAMLLMITAVCTVTLSHWLNRTLSNRALLLSDEAKTVMRGYAADAEQAWLKEGAPGVAAWIAAVAEHEPGDIMVVSQDDQSLSGMPLTESERDGLRFQRGLEWRMSFRIAPCLISVCLFPSDRNRVAWSCSYRLASCPLRTGRYGSPC